MTHILVADDEAGIRETLSSIFRDEGYRVSVAATRIWVTRNLLPGGRGPPARAGEWEGRG